MFKKMNDRAKAVKLANAVFNDRNSLFDQLAMCAGIISTLSYPEGELFRVEFRKLLLAAVDCDPKQVVRGIEEVLKIKMELSK